MNMSHYKAFELFQKSIDGLLSAEERAMLNQHLATCVECRTDVALYRKLEARARHPIVAVSRQDVQQAIHKTRAHFVKRRALKRLLSPFQTLAWVGAAVALTVAVMWTLYSSSQIGASLEAEHSLATSTPEPANATPTIPPLPTPRPRTYTNLYLPSYLHAQENVMADVDLNCDGLDERVVNIDAYSVFTPQDTIFKHGTVGIILQEPYDRGYRQVWEYRCHWQAANGSPACHKIEVEILASDNCTQFLAVSGSFDDRSSPRLIVFRWDGQNMSVVLDVIADDWKATQDPFAITTMLRDHCVASPHRCDDEEINHTWNGIEFIREK